MSISGVDMTDLAQRAAAAADQAGRVATEGAKRAVDAAMKDENGWLSWTANKMSDGVSRACSEVDGVAHKIDDGATAWLLGSKEGQPLPTSYRFHQALPTLAIGTFCALRAGNNLAEAWDYMPIPILRANKMVKVENLRLDGRADVNCNQMRIENRSVFTATWKLMKAAMWTAGCAGSVLMAYHQLEKAKNAPIVK